MSFIFQPMTTAGLFIHGSEYKFPVRRVYCVGRNYAAHAREMGFDPDREPPFFFCKPNDLESIVPVNTDPVNIPYPTETSNFHYEIELVVAIGKDAKNVSVEDAVNYIYGYAVGLDMTRRDLQMGMREKGRPWEIGKAFDFSAPIGPIHSIQQTGELNQADIHLTVNDATKQRSDISHLIWSVAETIANLSTLFELKAGDLIFTGTPEGVGAVVKGDVMRADIDGLTGITVNVQ
ncbi:fumarylacetoacetate hydrolase family protein [Acinetobacter sp. S40]|uniref:fumarylacetoacetate hydrolase family protein n=1 Tax=unclassified Acinetobacter TaxID=196816 RepID=UPI00190B8AE9|nr:MULTISPECIES: fumarylacetoacetate hydrolase family protein [unclassified Acinetobacter]MBJ9984672.1 fumarylacetoacetate hydrolase family protein [Acinetobacter sp. S40]MBK0062437.1 fumarylacetoacetate hydrolase family protein [Acinetobacter sp. S55]MBK0066241.1 fumarylacetoacetate hydrolase family protein [Acinetobacter sp. S54]